MPDVSGATTLAMSIAQKLNSVEALMWTTLVVTIINIVWFYFKGKKQEGN